MAVCVEIRRGSATTQVTGIDDLLPYFRTQEVARTIAEVRKIAPLWWAAKKRGDEYNAKKYKGEMGKLKNGLPGVCFSASTFKPHEWKDKEGRLKPMDTWRHQQFVVMNGLFMVDLDEVEDPMALWSQLVEKGVMDWKPFFAFVTPSGYGLKIVMPCSIERGNLYQNQAAFAKAFGVDVVLDDKCKDASRISYVATSSDIILSFPEVTSYENEEYVARWNGRYNDGSADVDLFPDMVRPTTAPGDAKVAEPELGAWVNAQLSAIREHRELEVDGGIEGQDYDGIPLKEIMSLYFERVTAKMKSRHDTMLKAAGDLRHVCDNTPKVVYYYLLRQGFVQEQVLEGRDIARTINDGLNWKYTTKMPEVLGKAIKELSAKSTRGEGAVFNDNDMYWQLCDFGSQLGKLSRYYPCMPELFRLTTEISERPAFLMAAACMLGTLATRCYYHHYWRPQLIQRLNYQVYIVALPGQGKGGIDLMNNILTQPLKDNDEPQFKVLNDYKRKSLSMSNSSEKAKNEANKKDLIEKPQTTIRTYGANSTNGAMIEDMENNAVEVDGHMFHLHMYSFDTEMDSVTTLNKSEYRDKQSWELKAFHNEEINQQFKNNNSITGFFNVFWNFIYTGTPTALYRKITKRNFGSGLSTRMAVIPLGADLFGFSGYNNSVDIANKDARTLSMWAYRMDKAQGELPLEDIVRATFDWGREKMDVARMEKDGETAFLIKRVSYYGIHGAAPYILMRHWEEWMEKHTFKTDEKDKELCLLFTELQLFCQRLFFGRFTQDYLKDSMMLVEEQSHDAESEKLMEKWRKLPDEFKLTDVVNQLGIKNAYARQICAKMLKSGLVTSNNSKPRLYKKVKKDKAGQ